MKQWFCMHVPMIVTRVVALEVNHHHEAVAADVRQAAKDLRNDVMKQLRGLNQKISTDVWIDSEQQIGLSDSLGIVVGENPSEILDCDGIETYYNAEN